MRNVDIKQIFVIGNSDMFSGALFALREDGEIFTKSLTMTGAINDWERIVSVPDETRPLPNRVYGIDNRTK